MTPAERKAEARRDTLPTSTGTTLRPALFLDRDGCLSEEIGYVDHESRYRLLPRSSAAIRLLNALAIPAVLVTNQAGVARGYFKEEMIGRVHARMADLLAADGARLDGVYYCMHHPTAGAPPYRLDCDCRKPKPGLIERASRDLSLDPARSWVVGDKISDIELAHRVGARGILVLTGYGRGETECLRDRWKVQPDRIVNDLFDAALVVAQDFGCLKPLA